MYWHVFVIYLPICNRLSWCWHPFVALIMTISIQLKIQMNYVRMYYELWPWLKQFRSSMFKDQFQVLFYFSKNQFRSGKVHKRIKFERAQFLISVYIGKLIYYFSELKLNFCTSRVTSSYIVPHYVLQRYSRRYYIFFLSAFQNTFPNIYKELSEVLSTYYCVL